MAMISSSTISLITSVYWDKCIEYEGPGVEKIQNELYDYVSTPGKIVMKVGHLKRAMYRETFGLDSDTEVTDEMLKATTKAQLFPMASQFADEDMEEGDEETSQGTAEDSNVEAEEKGAA